MRDSEAREVERAEERKGGGDCSEKKRAGEGNLCNQW